MNDGGRPVNAADHRARPDADRRVDWAGLLYPALFAAFPVLSTAASSPGYYALSDVLQIAATLALCTMTACVVLALALRLLRRAGGSLSDPDAAAAGAVLFGVALLYGAVPVTSVARRLAPALPSGIALGGIAVLVVGAMIALRQRFGVPLRRLLATAGVILVAWSGVRLAVGELRAAPAARRSALVRALERPVPIRRAPDQARGPAAARPDIYLIVLDTYANAAVLRELYGFDNRPFEDSLRALGFRIPTETRSNYANTIQSLPSLLNFEHITTLAASAGSGFRDASHLSYLIEHNRAARFLRAQGYRVIAFPSAWWDPTQRTGYADERFEAVPERSLGRELNRSDLRRALVDKSLLRGSTYRTWQRAAADAKHALRTFAGLKDVPSRPAPTFAFAHFMLPHRPYVVDADCRPLTPATGARRGGAGAQRPGVHPATRAAVRASADSLERGWYLDQLQCVNRQTLDLVTTLIARSPSPPVIILQGDHGPMLLRPFADSHAAPNPSQAWERFGAFGAYYLPGGGDRVLPDTVTPVNVLRYVFGYYFGADLPPREDALFFSHQKSPYAFIPLDSRYRILRHGVAAAALGSAAGAPAADATPSADGDASVAGGGRALAH